MVADILIENAQILDGTGEPAFLGFVAVAGQDIVAVGKGTPPRTETRRRIDARGRYVSPGFIDVHSHSDLSLLVDPTAHSRISQGITTEVIGNCGLTPAPCPAAGRDDLRQLLAFIDYGSTWTWEGFDEFLDRLDALRTRANFVAQVGHCALRASVVGWENRAATASELERMKGLLADALDCGAVGMSTGLIYPPGMFAETDEIVELGRELHKRDAIYSSHIRGESYTLDLSIDEAIRIGQLSGASVEISHLKATSGRLRGRLFEIVERIERANTATPVSYDVYPYCAGSANLSQLFPPDLYLGGIDAMLAGLRDPVRRAWGEKEMTTPSSPWPAFIDRDYSKIFVSAVNTEANKRYEGKHLAEIAELRGCSAEEACVDLVLEEENDVAMVNFVMDEDDVRTALRGPLASVGSDGLAIGDQGPTRKGKPHPRYFATFPRYLAHYVRDEKLIPLSEAIHRCTLKAAAKFGLRRRGRLVAGSIADVVLFDLERMHEGASFADPYRAPSGIDQVIVRGEVVVEDGRLTPALPGRLLRRA